jgi:hypothetical protein
MDGVSSPYVQVLVTCPFRLSANTFVREITALAGRLCRAGGRESIVLEVQRRGLSYVAWSVEAATPDEGLDPALVFAKPRPPLSVNGAFSTSL